MCCPTPEPTEHSAEINQHPPACNTQPNKRRRVSFHRFASTTSVATLTNLPDEIQNQIWYRSSDIEEFRDNARDLCRKLRRRQTPPKDESARGLEFRIDAERQARKDLTIKCVLRAQRRTSNPRALAHIYRKCSTWTIVASAMVARSDFFNAYDLATTCDTAIPNMESYPLPFRSRCEKKRTASDISTPSSPSGAQRRART